METQIKLLISILTLAFLLVSRINLEAEEKAKDSDFEFVLQTWDMLYTRSFTNRKEVPLLDWSIADEIRKATLYPSASKTQSLKQHLKTMIEKDLGPTEFRRTLLEQFD